MGFDRGLVARFDLRKRLLGERLVDDVGVLDEVDVEVGLDILISNGEAAERFGARIKTDGGCGIFGELLGGDVVVVEVDDAALEGEYGDLAVAFGLPERAVGEAERRRA